ncbi:MAG: sulfotransferase domain-containing protein [Verrucomicrobia bacterium]|nr:sulfotransferase domain-containing protein [Verrucomicrobiota bacterium]
MNIPFLNKNRFSIEKENYRTLQEYSGNICFITSYPRSGNTWLRYLITDVLLNLRGERINVLDIPDYTNNVIPDIHINNILETQLTPQQNLPVFCKTHHNIEKIKRNCKKHDIIFLYLVRDPFDALVSHYHYQTQRCNDSKIRDVDAFCLKELRFWIEHSHMALSQVKSKSLLVIKYETLLTETEFQVFRFFSWLGLKIEKEMIECVVKKMQFQALQKMEKSGTSPLPNTLFFRKGKAGTGREELKHSTILQIEKETSGILDELHFLNKVMP